MGNDMTFNEEKEKMLRIASNFKDAAFPVTIELQYETDKNISYRATSKGLSKREYFAAMAMSGLQSSNFLTDGYDMMSIRQIAELAVRQADRLIEALNKQAEIKE